MTKSKEPQRLLPQVEDLLKQISQYNYKSIRKELLDKILKKIHQPEEKVRYYWIQKLVNEFGYESRQIEIEVPAGIELDPTKPVRADIVVYRDFDRTEAFIEGEVEPPGQRDDILRAEGYARNLGCEYHFWSNKDETQYFRTSRYPRRSEPIGTIPYWVGKKAKIERVPKTKILAPFKDETQLRGVVSVCHDLIWAKLGHDPAKSFDELTKLLFLKLFDERETPNYYEFVVLADEKPKDTAKRIRALFDKAKTSPRYRDVFESKFVKPENVTLEVDNFTIYKVVQQLQGFSLVATTENIRGADIKGTVFEEMVGGTFRGELGQFFTPRQLVEFMVKMLDPDINDRVLDPACGSGGFLIMSIRMVKERIKREMPNLGEAEIAKMVKDFAENNVFGTDINDRMARVAKMNMIMHGDGHSGIFNVNGLFVADDDPEKAKKEVVENSFEIIFSNPPFAGYEKEPEVLRRFELGVRGKRPRSVTKEIVFVERIIRLLKNGGCAAIVLPQGIYSDKKLNFARNYIKKHAKILALIALPIWAFRPSGTGVRGSLLFIQKLDKVPSDYKIFVKKVEHIGYDSKGKPDYNELDSVIGDYKTGRNEDDWITFSGLESCMGYTNTGRIDPKFFIREARDILKTFEDSPYEVKELSSIAKFRRERYNPKKEPDREFVYIEVNDVNVQNGHMRKRLRKGKDVTQGTFVVREGDLIVSRRWPDRGAISIVPKEFHGALIVSEFSVLQINPQINKNYIYWLMRTRQFLDLLDVYTTGEMSHRISEEDFKRIKIPIPPISVQNSIVNEVKSLRKKAQDLTEEARKLRIDAQDHVAEMLKVKRKVGLKKRVDKVMYGRI